MSDESQNQKLPGIDEGLASDESILKAHARICREPIHASPVFFFTCMALITILVFGWFYHRRYMGENDPQIYMHERTDIALYRDWVDRPRGPIEYDYFAIGQELYTKMACVGCHMAEGEGKAGEFPPLASSQWVTNEDHTLPTKILLAGLVGPVTVKGAEYNGNMAPYGPALKDHEIAGLVTYIRQSWGNEASEVTLEQVAEVRAEIGTRAQWTADELTSYFE